MVLLGLAADVSQNAAVGVQDLTVHKVGSVACKEHAGAHHVVRLTPAACGGLGGDELVEGGGGCRPAAPPVGGAVWAVAM